MSTITSRSPVARADVDHQGPQVIGPGEPPTGFSDPAAAASGAPPLLVRRSRRADPNVLRSDLAR
jgi:hypothetical protein